MSRIFVGNVAFRTEADQLKAFIEENGIQVKEVVRILNPETGEFKGFCFVEIEGDAQDAIDILNGLQMFKRKLAVGVANPRPEKPRGPRA